MSKQVDFNHYQFDRYMSKERWISVWHQLDEIQKLRPETVLEIGPGAGLFKSVAATFGIRVETLDLDPDLKPDYIGSATAIPLPDARFDVVCAFQMLEHLPYEVSLQAFAEMVRISAKHVVISLPDALDVWRYQIHIPGLGLKYFLFPRPRLRTQRHEFDGQHYWEINTRGFSLSRVVLDFEKLIRLVTTYRVPDNPYHRFFVFKR
jgi:hypothetical protein